MFKSRGLTITLIFMTLVLIAAAAVYFYMAHAASEKKDMKNPSIDQIVNDLSVSTGEITTNIKDDHFIKVDFNIQVSNQVAKSELTERSFQVKNAVIYTVSSMTSEDLSGQQGIANLENQMMNRINGFLKSGKVTHVYTTEMVVQ
ncbi:MAG: flagellar basal body-associated FliL family protein [Sporolactobacillus sp.]